MTKLLNEQIAAYTALLDEALAEGDEDSATELLAAIESACDKLDAM